MEEPSRLPVYLIHWDKPEWCAAATASILQSRGIDVDLTVVDNGQTTGPPLATLLPDGVRVLPQPENRGYAGAANVALRDWRARFPAGELCVVGSHDVEVELDALARLVAIARRETSCGVVAPALVDCKHTAGGAWDGRRAFRLPADGAPDLVRTEWAAGTCLLLRRACVDDVGPFDERIGTYVEDVDYGLRANSAGWDVLVVTSAKAYGQPGTSSLAIRYIAANTVLLSVKRRGLQGALGTLALFASWVARGYVASLVPWREATQRAESRRYAVERTIGLYGLISSGRLVRALRDTEWRTT